MAKIELWRRIGHFSGLSTYGLTAKAREMSTPPTLQSGAWSPLSYLKQNPDFWLFILLPCCYVGHGEHFQCRLMESRGCICLVL